jgi:hypothetical protein
MHHRMMMEITGEESARTANPVQTTGIIGVKKGPCGNGVDGPWLTCSCCKYNIVLQLRFVVSRDNRRGVPASREA